MPEPIFKTEPGDNHRYKGREFAEPPATINTKCFPDHTEMSWHTPQNIPAMVRAVIQLIEESNLLLMSDVTIKISGTDGEPIEGSTLQFSEFLNVVDPMQISGRRCQYNIDEVAVVWADREEPIHETLRESGERDLLPHHITLRGPPGEGQTTKVARELYEVTGDPALSSVQRVDLISNVIHFIIGCELQR